MNTFHERPNATVNRHRNGPAIPGTAQHFARSSIVQYIDLIIFSPVNRIPERCASSGQGRVCIEDDNVRCDCD